MSIRFKFRSSVAFDSVDLGGRHSISVRDLRDKIVAHKKLQICKDFDLLISDAETGAAFEDDELLIKEGSSVVIKRVPAGQRASRDFVDRNVVNVERKDIGDHAERVVNEPNKNADKENFDDFGVDLYPILQGSFPEFDDDVGNMNFSANKRDNIVHRFSETSVSRCQNNERSDLSEAMSKEVIGDNCGKESDTDEIQKQIRIGAEKEVPQKVDEHIIVSFPTMLDMDLPTELRCSLCTAIFKDAVMIPCCQHSFCEKCIRLALVEKGQCPKCSSTKCTVEALLPNLSLRQAIEHFLEAQAMNNALENKNPQYIPDVESGIHAKEVSCAVSIRKKEPPCMHSPSATKGSNQVTPETAYENRLTGSMRKSAALPLRMKLMKGDEISTAEALNHLSSFPGGYNSSKFRPNFMREEVNIAAQKNKGIGVTVLDGSENLMPSIRHRKGDRTCYLCGSPNHLIRDCPAASNSYPFNQTGDASFAGGMPLYGHAYWNGNAFPQATHYGNMYAPQGMMPFSPTMPSMSPYGLPPYMSSMYAGAPGPYGFMRTGCVQPSMTPRAERPLLHQAFVERLEGNQKHISHTEREHDFDPLLEDHSCKGPRRTSHERQHQVGKGTAGIFLDDDSPRIQKKHAASQRYDPSHRQTAMPSDEELPSVERRHERGSRPSISGRDQRAHHPEKSNSEVQQLSDSSNRHSREKKRHHHGISLKRESERKGQYASDISRKSGHRSRKEISENEKVAADHKKFNHKHHGHSESSFERNVSSEHRQHHKEKEAGHSSKSSRQIPKSKDDRLDDERWEMVEGLDDEYRGANYHKRRRTR